MILEPGVHLAPGIPLSNSRDIPLDQFFRLEQAKVKNNASLIGAAESKIGVVAGGSDGESAFVLLDRLKRLCYFFRRARFDVRSGRCPACLRPWVCFRGFILGAVWSGDFPRKYALEEINSGCHV